jgi:hypothetical protein
MFNSSFEFITNLQYQVKSLTARVKAFESGEKFVSMRSDFMSQISAKDREIRNLKLDIADANCRIVTVRENWMQVFDDIEIEHAKKIQLKDREIEALRKKLLETEGKLATIQESLRWKGKELYETLVELEEEKGRNQKLKAQINRDYENSSIPSSMKPNRKKISNNREKTGRKPGGQPGHKGHGRKRLTPTNMFHIPAPEEYANNPEYRPTGRMITKQVVNLRVNVIVDEYSTPEFRNVQTGQRVHAHFPDSVVNDVNYGGSIKAFSFLLNNRYCVSTDKVREFLSELTDGELQISNGMINGLCKVFSGKTEAEQKAMFSDLILTPVMNTDFTSARLNGNNVQVIVCATPEKTMYFAREHKGHEGTKGTPVEDYQGILVHDHDLTFYSYGGGHQECLTHSLRYLKDIMVNEPDLTWHKQMRELIQEIIHHRNSMDSDTVNNAEKVNEYKARYKKILAIAQEEYEYNPPGKYYKDGYNLYKRLDKYMDNHLLFLDDIRVPTNNNLSERLLRIFKRKQKQAMTFRSFDSLSYLCNSMGIIESFRSLGKNIYKTITSIFN